jgi:hypothetical protein
MQQKKPRKKKIPKKKNTVEPLRTGKKLSYSMNLGKQKPNLNNYRPPYAD